MAETATPLSGITRDDGTVETTASTIFRSLSSLASLKASADDLTSCNWWH